MDFSKLPPTGLPASQTESPPSKQRLLGELANDITQDLQQLEKPSPISGRAEIRPLDTKGGLQILLAEIRAAFDMDAESIGNSETMVASPIATARQVVEWVLQSLPADASDAVVWTAALVRTESGLQVGLAQATAVVSHWHDVTAEVLDAVELSAALVLQVLSDDRPNPLWLRPEWLGLAPRLDRFWRRRRAARRRLTDPDHRQGGLDDLDEQRR